VAEIERPLDLSRAAQLAGVDVDTLRALNPGQLQGSISPVKTHEILLPIGTLNLFEANIAKLSPEELVHWKTYRIKPGDSLGGIAEQFDTRVTLLQQANGIKGSQIRVGDTLKIPDGGAPTVASGKLAAQDYQVREGDSLYRIAHKFKVSINDIIAWNALDPAAYLRPGQQLTLYASGG
jgi:membrane-bound lytic murein transglycosylase D